MEVYIVYPFYGFLFYWVLRKKVSFIYFIPLFGLGMDISVNLFGGFSTPAYVRGAIFLMFFYGSRRYLTSNNLFSPFYLFFAWLLLLLSLSGELLYSFKAVIQIIFSMSVFIIAYNFFDSQEKLFKLLRSLIWVVIVAILATAVGYIFGIGQVFDYQGKYDEEEQIIGLLGSSGLYAPGMVISILPIILKIKLKPFQKFLLPFICIVLYIFMLLTVRRTVILIPIVGFIVYFFYRKQRLRIIKIFGITFLILLLSYPLYGDMLLDRIQTRQKTGRFEEDFYKTEQRYLENLQLFEAISTFNEPAKILFGIGNNMFAENIEDGQIVRRMYHTDFAKLVYSIGLFGLLIYIVIYIAIYNRIRSIPNHGVFSDYKAAALGLFLISIFVSFNGSVTIITFRSINFLILGAILGYVRHLRIMEYYSKTKQE